MSDKPDPKPAHKLSENVKPFFCTYCGVRLSTYCGRLNTVEMRK